MDVYKYFKICTLDKTKEEQFKEDVADLDDLCDDEDADSTNIDICKSDKDKPIIVKKTKKIYKNDDNDNDCDTKDLAAYNMGYRNGKFDIINKMPFNDAFPFDDKDGQTWYKIGYRSGWDSGK